MSTFIKVTIEQARRYVGQYTAGCNPELRERVAQRMVTGGKGVWHSLAEETGKPCWCAECRPDVKSFA